MSINYSGGIFSGEIADGGDAITFNGNVCFDSCPAGAIVNSAARIMKS